MKGLKVTKQSAIAISLIGMLAAICSVFAIGNPNNSIVLAKEESATVKVPLQTVDSSFASNEQKKPLKSRSKTLVYQNSDNRTTITLTDEKSGQAIEGGIFQLDSCSELYLTDPKEPTSYACKDAKTVGTYTTNADGITTIDTSSFKDKSYYLLTQIKAPSGYNENDIKQVKAFIQYDSNKRAFTMFQNLNNMITLNDDGSFNIHNLLIKDTVFTIHIEGRSVHSLNKTEYVIYKKQDDDSWKKTGTTTFLESGMINGLVGSGYYKLSEDNKAYQDCDYLEKPILFYMSDNHDFTFDTSSMPAGSSYDSINHILNIEKNCYISYISKINSSGAMLKGSSWDIQSTDTNGNNTNDLKLSFTDNDDNDLLGNYDGQIGISLGKGYYSLKETKAPEGYEINHDLIRFKFDGDSVSLIGTPSNTTINTNRIIVTDIKKQTTSDLIINKINVSGNPLKGATFKLESTDEDGNVSNSYNEDIADASDGSDDGRIIFKNVSYGYYKLTETKAPKGYQLDSRFTPIRFKWYDNTITIISSPSGYIHLISGNSITINNYLRKPLNITKLNESGKLISGASFKIESTNESGTYNGSYRMTVSDDADGADDGQLSFKNVPFGYVKITETKAPDGYKLAEPSVIKYDEDGCINVSGPATCTNNTVKVTDYPKTSGTLRILKNDGNFGLAGSSFKVESTNESGIYNGSYRMTVSDDADGADDGQLSFKNVPFGYVKITETKAPKGYQFAEPSIIKFNGSYEYDDCKVISGTATCGFNFGAGTGAQGYVSAIGVRDYPLVKTSVSWKKTNSNGDLLPNSEWILSNTTTNILDSCKTIRINDNQSAGDCRLADTNSQDGQFTVDSLPAGDYMLTEAVAPSGYKANLQTIRFTLGNDGKITGLHGGSNVDLDNNILVVKDEPKPTYIVKSVQFETVPDYYSERLAGAVITLNKCADSKCKAVSKVADYTTPKNGQVEIETAKLDAGYYQFIETTAPEGYDKPSSALGILSYDPITNKFTDVDTSSNLMKTYRTKKYSWSNEWNEQYINIINNKTKKYSLTLVKQNEQGTNLSGSQWSLWSTTDDVADGKIKIDVTDDSSDDMLPYSPGYIKLDGLSDGDYSLAETTAPDGYYVLDGIIKINIDKDGNIKLLNNNSSVSIQSGQIIIKDKKIPYTGTTTLLWDKVGKSKLDSSDNIIIDGSSWVLESTDSTGTPNGRYKQIFDDTYTSNSFKYNGTFKADNLEDGYYTLTEIRAPWNYILDSTPIRFKLTAIDRYSSSIDLITTSNNTGSIESSEYSGGIGSNGGIVSLDIPNTIGSSTVKVVDYSDHTKLLPKAKFTWYGCETSKCTDKKSLFTKVSNDSGLITITSDDNYQLSEYLYYEIIEDEQPNGYIEPSAIIGRFRYSPFINSSCTMANDSGLILSPAVQGTFTDHIGETSYCNYYKINQETAFSNNITIMQQKDIPTGTLMFSKVDPMGNALVGSSWKLMKDNKDYESLKDDNENGTFVVNNLLPGSYQLIETTAPKGYQINSDPYTFNVDNTGKLSYDGNANIVNGFLSITNEPIPSNVNITWKKTDYLDNLLKDSKWNLISTDSNGVQINNLSIGDNSSNDTNNQEGIISVNVQSGYYKLIETVAPKGYLLDSTPIAFYVNTDGSIKLLSSSDDVHLDSNVITAINYAEPIVNKTFSDFPQTGAFGIIAVAVTAAVVTMLISYGVLKAARRDYGDRPKGGDALTI